MAMKNYTEKKEKENLETMQAILNHLPSFVSEFSRGINAANSTKLGYIYDIRLFFEFLEEKKIAYIKSLSDLEKIKAEHIEVFLENSNNKAVSKSRKLSALRRLYDYFIKKEKIKNNPANIVETPKIPQKNITKLDVDEIARLLDSVEDGENLTKTQKNYHSHTKIRDLAIITLLLGTGLRLSECIGIDINHINFEQNAILITRKGGNEDIVYFSQEVERALKDYLKERLEKKTAQGHENAFFLSMQNKRIGARTVQNLIKKYTKIFNLKNISTHKLRSTYGTNLYRETGDIYLVAAVLGHKDVNTTRKHYATMDEDRKKQAAKIVKLRED
ncbi:MAG: tyrosine-type recombinase/integrase [Defluviitaleaceae bacterium]|nr:tyrosine-type recombinase/integrase [Defluviitaleaceae bacterium]